MTVFDHLKQVTGVRHYASAQHNKDVLDAYFLRQARQSGVRLPTGTDPERYKYHGAYVATPRAGLDDHVVYVDLSSLYPNGMLALNVGPDTIIGTESELAASRYDESDCVWGYIDPRPVKHHVGGGWQDFAYEQFKMIYDPDQSKTRWVDDPRYERCYYLHPDEREGFIASGMRDLIDMKYEYEGDLYEAVKRVVNSAYGFMGYATESNSSRLYDWRIAESITLMGRKVIQFTADAVRQYLADEFGVPLSETFVKMGDTDGVGICWPDAPDGETHIQQVSEACAFLNEHPEGYARFMHEEFGVPRDRHHMEVEVESYATTAFVPAADYERCEEGIKKRYAQHVAYDEGDEVDTVPIKGFEAVRSDIAPLTAKLQSWVLERLVRHGKAAREDIFDICRAVEQTVRAGRVPVHEIAKRGGISQDLSEYGSPSRRPSPLYRGAKFADEYLDVRLSQGSKPFCVRLASPQGLPRTTYLSRTAENGDVVDAISVEHPSDLPDGLDVDYDEHADNTVVDPLRPILRTMGWSWEGVRDDSVQDGLDNWM